MRKVKIIGGALHDAGIAKEQLQGAWVGNAAQGVLQGQESIRGQVVLGQNAGGTVGGSEAALSVTILKR